MSKRSRRIIYNKLVRDKIPSVIRKNGGVSKTRILNSAAFKQELLRKAVEEARELEGLTDRSEIIAELGDTLDVLDSIQQTFRITKQELSASRKKAMKKKGGFKKRLYLYWTTDTGYKSKSKGKSQKSKGKK